MRKASDFRAEDRKAEDRKEEALGLGGHCTPSLAVAETGCCEVLGEFSDKGGCTVDSSQAKAGMGVQCIHLYRRFAL